MNDGFDLAGKVALVTGSSRGIGAGIVRALADRGARCVVNFVDDPAGRNRAEAETVASGLNDAILLQCDVGDPARVGDMMDQVRQQLGGLDILVNNAGILRDRTFKKITPQDWDDVLRINLGGVFNCTRSAVSLMRPGGRIGISDIVAEDSLTSEQRADRGSYVGCIAGALSFGEFEEGLRAVGLTDVSVTPTHSVADGMHSAIIRATKPEGAGAELPAFVAAELPFTARGCGCGDGCC